ncbi:MAG: hypothetical protein ABH808_03915, partial [Candidatus Kuenenbacteria bacterium]
MMKKNISILLIAFLLIVSSFFICLNVFKVQAIEKNKPQQNSFDPSSFNKEKQITTNLSDQYNPAIYGDKIVWQNNGNGNSDIYMYNLSTKKESRITTNLSDQYSPAIYRDKIVWQDWRNGNSDIYMYNLSTKKESRITTNSKGQFTPAIYGNKIVWQDWRNGNSGNS